MKKTLFFVLVALSMWSCRSSRSHTIQTYDSTYTHRTIRDTVFKVAPVTIKNSVNLDSVLRNLKSTGQKETIIYKRSENGNYLKLLIKENGEMMAVCHQTEQELRAQIQDQQTIITKQSYQLEQGKLWKSFLTYVVIACVGISMSMLIASFVLRRK